MSAATSQVSISGNVITIEDTARGTIAAYAITPASIGAGTYSKPSDGIPASDLADGVLPVFTDNGDGIETINGSLIVAMYDDKGNRISTTVEGKYTKPSDGIPKTDLASDVQTSLGKADTALQEHQSLANYQTNAITDTGGYFTTDTVEGALQEIGAELAGVNTLIGSGVIS